MSPHALAAIVASCLLLGGCVIHVGADEDDRHLNFGSVEKQEARNRDRISQLAIGTPLEQVRAELGEPDFTEAWTSQGHEVRVLRYRTHRTEADGDTTPDETTPLVFKGGKLVGIGDRALASAAGR